MDLSMNNIEQLYQTILTNIRDNILNSYGINTVVSNNSFGQNVCLVKIYN